MALKIKLHERIQGSNEHIQESDMFEMACLRSMLWFAVVSS